MTALVDPAADVTDLAKRVGDAIVIGGDRLDPAAASHAVRVLDRIGERAVLGMQHTVVAFAGPTGSGKSSLFNAIAGLPVSPTGVRRPTTSAPVACVWGEGASPLLDWLDVPSRHRTERITELDDGRERQLQGLVLLDMPDHDSRELDHRQEVDRLVALVDLLVWVVDPQKYADAVLHGDYLRRLAFHEDVMVVVLNQVDTLPPESVSMVAGDLQRILGVDGIAGTDVLVTSASTGDGVDRLRALLADAVASREVAVARARGDLLDAAARLADGVAPDEAAVESASTDAVLVTALARAAGVPAVLDAVERSYRRRAARWTGWPLTRWVAGLRVDPLRRLRVGGAPAAPAGGSPDVGETGRHASPPSSRTRDLLGRLRPGAGRDRDGTAVVPGEAAAVGGGGAGDGVTGGLGGVAAGDIVAGEIVDRTSLPAPGPAPRARVDLAVRRLLDEAASGLPPRWAAATRDAVSRSEDLRDALDRAVATVDLRLRDPWWWRAVGVVHVALLAAAVVGLVVLMLLSAVDFLRLPAPAVPTAGGIPVPTVALLVGLVGGPLLALLAGRVAATRARARRVRVETDYLVAIAAVARDLVLDPVAGVLADHRRCRDLLTS